MKKSIELLSLMLKASKDAALPLNMRSWYNCGTSCCLCGDVAIYNNAKDIHEASSDFADLLDKYLGGDLAESIYSGFASHRKDSLEYFFKNSELDPTPLLEHPHLSSDHEDRAIAQDYIREVIKLLETELV